MTGVRREVEEPAVPLTLADLVHQLDWRSEALGVLLVLAESVIIYVLAGVVLDANETGATFPFWVIAMLLLTAHIVTHLLAVARVWSPEFEVILTSAIVVTLAIAIRAANFPQYDLFDFGWLLEAANGLAFFATDAVRNVWGTVALAIFAWWRGRSREDPSIDSAFTMMRWGTLAFIVAVIFVLLTASQSAEIRDQLSIATLGYFAFALGAVGLARMRVEGFRSSTALEAGWLSAFVVPILVIGLVAVLGAGIFSRQFFDTLVWIIAPLLWLLEMIFRLLILIIAVIAYLILTPIFWLIGERDFFAEAPTAAPPTATETDQGQSVSQAVNIPEPLQYLIAAIVLVIIISFLVRFLYRRRTSVQATSNEERESVFDWDDLLPSLGGRLRGLFQRSEEADPYAELRADPRWRHTLTIRERYRSLQSLGAKLERGRRSGQTAEDYRPRIGSAFPGGSQGREAIDEMTAIYRQARYSGEPAPESAADRMVDRWQVVEREAPLEDDS